MIGRSARRGAVALVAAAVALALTACSPATPAATPPAPQPLTEEQAERLAVVRFRNFDAGLRAIDIRIPSTEVGELRVTGWFDYAAGVGYAAASSDAGSLGLVWWNTSTIATREMPVEDAPLPLPADGWLAGELDPAASDLATVLTIVGSLAADRPENPQLLRQSDAAWLRADELAGIDVDVFAGPSGSDEPTGAGLDERTRYWVDAGGLLHRFEARLADDRWTLIDFAEGGGVELPTAVPGS